MIKILNKVIIAAFLSFSVIFAAQINVCAVKNVDGRFPTNKQLQAVAEKKVRGAGICRYLSKRAGVSLKVGKSKILLSSIEAHKSEIAESFSLDIPIVTATNKFVASAFFEVISKRTYFDDDSKRLMTTFDLVKMFFYSNEFNAEDFEWRYSCPCGGYTIKSKLSSKYPPLWGKRTNVTYEDYQQEGFLEQVNYDRFTKEPPMDILVHWRLTNMHFFEIVPDEIVPVPVSYNR